jgi:hypothetical protein
MPLSSFQRQVLLLLKASRNPESYVAGGTVIQRDAASLRYSSDIDFFHDTDLAVTTAFQSDRATLVEHDYAFEILISQPSFYRATISRGQDQLKLDWVRDTAFRFFPVVDDPDFGYRLHDVDLAINKSLALANRSELRDVLDIVELDSKILSLAGCVWAACGKDPGFTPELMLDLIQRHAIITPDLLALEALRQPVDPKKLKSDLSRLLTEARQIIPTLDPADIGCIYVDGKGAVLRDLGHLESKDVTRHFGTVKGTWPRLST